jgi:hypothetical protein
MRYRVPCSLIQRPVKSGTVPPGIPPLRSVRPAHFPIEPGALRTGFVILANHLENMTIVMGDYGPRRLKYYLRRISVFTRMKPMAAMSSVLPALPDFVR